jgi:hypothetical protein
MTINDWKIALIAGQSCAQGTGRNIPAQQPIDYNIQKLTAIPNVWEVASEPVSMFKPWYGPSMSFARRLRNLGVQGTIGLINAAVGGTSISQWQRGETAYENLYLAATTQTQGNPFCVLFIQGETDANTGYHDDDWKDLFQNFVSDLREDLEMPNLPFVFGLLGAEPDEGISPGFNHWTAIRDQQKLVSIPRVKYFSRWGIPRGADDVHDLSTEGYDISGTRAANQLYSLL